MNKWELQEKANKEAFSITEEFSSRYQIFSRIVPALERSKVRWGLSCSASLFFMGLVDDFHDFDIICEIDDVNKMENALSECGIVIKHDTVQKRCFSSTYYKEARFNDVHFDLVGNFTVNTYGCSYVFTLKEDSPIYNTSLEEGIVFPLIPLEANLILYGMMEGWQSKRRFKRELCREYLQEYGIKYPHILEDAIKQGLPTWLQEVVTALL